MLDQLKKYMNILESNPLYFGGFTEILKLHTSCLLSFLDKEEKKTEKKEPISDERYISLLDFYSQTGICSPQFICDYSKTHPEFKNRYIKVFGQKSYVQKNVLIKALVQCESPKIRKKAENYLKNKEQTERKNPLVFLNPPEFAYCPMPPFNKGVI